MYHAIQVRLSNPGCRYSLIHNHIQDPSDGLTPEQLAALDSRINTLRTETATAQATAKTLRLTLTSINATLSTADLLSSVNALEAEKADLESRIVTLKQGTAKTVTKEERDANEVEWKKWKGVCRRREGIVREMWKTIEDVLPEGVDKGELREILGLDE